MTQRQPNFALASLRTGRILQCEVSGDAGEQMAGLAATLPEIFGTVDQACLERIAARLGTTASGEGFAAVVLLSESYVHVMQPLPGRVGDALLAIAAAGTSVGLVLSQVHARALALESEP